MCYLETAKYIHIGISGSIHHKWVDPVRARALFFEHMDLLIMEDQRLSSAPICIHSGESDKGGIDTWAKEYAIDRGLKFIPHPPDFVRYSRPKAYYVRNTELVRAVGWLYAFLAPSESTDIKSRSGTMMTVREAIKQGDSVFVHTLVGDTLEGNNKIRFGGFRLIWKKLSWLEGWTENIRSTPL